MDSSDEERPYYNYNAESSSSDEEVQPATRESSDRSYDVATGFEPIESYKKKNVPLQEPGFGRKVSYKAGYDRELEEDEIQDNVVKVLGPTGWPVVRKQKPEYDREEEDEDDDYEEADPVVSEFEILNEEKAHRGLLEQQKWIARHHDEEEQQQFIARTTERQVKQTSVQDEDFDVISFATNDAQTFVEVNARHLNVEVHWRNGQRPGNGKEGVAVGKALTQALHRHG